MSCFYRWSSVLIVSVGAVFLIRTALCEAAVPPLELIAVSDAVRVFEDGYGFTNNQSQAQEINVFGLRSETISAQCVVRAGRDLPKLTATLTPLKKEGGNAQIPAENLTWRFVTDILVLTNTPRMWVSDLTRPAPARFPDCLSEDRQCAVTNGALKAIYLTLRIPADAEPGEYRGHLKASSDDVAATLPITLNVYPLTMPEQRHLLVVEWMSTRHFKKFHEVESDQSDRYWQILRAYAKNMVEHRHNTFKISLSLIKTTVDENGNYSLDFSEFDRYAQVFGKQASWMRWKPALWRGMSQADGIALKSRYMTFSRSTTRPTARRKRFPARSSWPSSCRFSSTICARKVARQDAFPHLRRTRQPQHHTLAESLRVCASPCAGTPQDRRDRDAALSGPVGGLGSQTGPSFDVAGRLRGGATARQ